MQQLHRLEQLDTNADELLALYPIPSVIIHKNTTILYANPRFAKLYNTTLSEMQGRRIGSFSDAAGKSVLYYFQRFAENDPIEQDEIYINGHYFQILIQPIYDLAHHVEAIFCLQWNITRIKRLQQVFYQNNKRHKIQLRTDPITSIANEHILADYLTHQTQHNPHQAITVLLLDVDYFEKFHQEHGFNQANAALYAIAQTLRHELRKEDDCLIKLNRDRFFILIPDVSQIVSITIAERLKSSIYQLNLAHHAGIAERLTVSSISHTLRLEELNTFNHWIHILGDELAIYKQQGRNRCHQYRPQSIDHSIE